ncbi:unnamed protein product [Cladocopium goreaui]|uniref:Uncharacterized protein n=1 Tax=Cladocopium goreaui TaxID=2562237 RepID=A0A9P1D877_9DINO|nr:unnamed protein product [Cladocopium goreaui]
MASPTLYNLHHAQTFPAVAPHVSVQPDLSPCRLQTRHLAVAGWPGDFSPTRANAYATPRFRAEVAQPLRPPSLMPTGPDAMKDGVFEVPGFCETSEQRGCFFFGVRCASRLPRWDGS